MRYEDMELVNYKNVLESIEELKSPSRATIAKYLSLSRTTVSNITTKLISLGILREGKASNDSSSRGKPGTPIIFDNRIWHALGAAFDGKAWIFVICNLSGNIVAKKIYNIGVITPESLIQTLIDGISSTISSFNGKLLPAIGIGAPGVVDSENGDILWAYDLKWNKRIPIRKVILDKFNIESYCLNRYTLAGLAEYKYANDEKEKNMIYVGLGAGIRSAIFVDGKLLEGASFSAGRIGHIQIDPNGKLCECGKRGCLLTLANEESLINNTEILRHGEAYQYSPLSTLEKEELNANTIIKYADEGDICARAAIDTIVEPLNTALSTLIDIINPKKIVIGGPIGYSSDYLVQKVQEAGEKIASETPYRIMKIEQGKIKEDGSALGAATLVLQNKIDLISLL